MVYPDQAGTWANSVCCNANPEALIVLPAAAAAGARAALGKLFDDQADEDEDEDESGEEDSDEDEDEDDGRAWQSIPLCQLLSKSATKGRLGCPHHLGWGRDAQAHSGCRTLGLGSLLQVMHDNDTFHSYR